MRILITGGFGYIGGRLGQYFHQQGSEIILASRKKRPSPAWLPGAEVALVKWDDTQCLQALCGGVDVVLHCAGMNAGDCAADPMEALEFNGMVTERLSSAASSSGVNTFFYLSTAHVYSRLMTGDISEDTNPINDHPYASSHLFGERAALALNQNSAMRVIVLRLSNIIGAPADKSADCWGLVANDLCRQAIQKGSLTLYTNGQQKRNFMGISQLSRAVDHLLKYCPERGSEIFNIGGKYSFSIIELAALIKDRFKNIFNNSLELNLPTGREIEAPLDFNYKIDRLLSTHFVLESGLEKDIDELLIFCKHSFKYLR